MENVMKLPIPFLSFLAVLACVCMGMPLRCRATEATDVWEVFGSFGKVRGFTGLVTSADHPEFLSGPGAFYIPPRGTFLIFR